MKAPVPASDIVLRCQCGLPWGRLSNGVLIIESRHHGQTHTNVIAVAELQRLAAGNVPAAAPLETKTSA